MLAAVLDSSGQHRLFKRVSKRPPKAWRPVREKSEAFWMRALALRIVLMAVLVSLPGVDVETKGHAGSEIKALISIST